ncbi:hypothetical protein C8Q74DRAFT_1362660 [Fomes fomentarius]|nr:hypothetical protein C8Q74DRAFT_1362660 [Fomes fomentarius]
MFPVRHFNWSVVRQICRHTSATARLAAQTRALTTSLTRQSAWIEGQHQRVVYNNSSKSWQDVYDLGQKQPKNDNKNKSPEAIWAEMEKSIVSQLQRPHNAYSGRSVPVVRDVGSALAMLKGILAINNVRSSHVRDERHEKKGEKRNRLRSLRWRRRFAHEVRKKVQLVNEIRARGA